MIKKRNWLAYLMLAALVLVLGNMSVGNAKGGHDNDDDDDGHGGEKVLLCHTPKKNPDKKHTISVSQKAAKKHLKKHPNDFLGDCSTAETCTLIVPCSCWDEDLLAIGNNPFYHLNEGAFCVSIIEEDGDINTTISFAGPEVTEARVVIKTEGNEVIGHLCASVHVSNGGTETAHDYSEFTAISEAEYLGCKAILENHSVCQQQPQCKPLRIPCADASECCDAAAICDPGCCLPDQQAGCLIDDDCCDSPCVNGTCVP